MRVSFYLYIGFLIFASIFIISLSRSSSNPLPALIFLLILIVTVTVGFLVNYYFFNRKRRENNDAGLRDRLERLDDTDDYNP